LPIKHGLPLTGGLRRDVPSLAVAAASQDPARERFVEHASFMITKTHRPQVLARVQALGLTYKEERARGGTKCTVLGTQEQLEEMQASLDEYWRQVEELDKAIKAAPPRVQRSVQDALIHHWRGASLAARATLAVAFLSILAVAVYFIGSPWSAEGKAINTMQKADLGYTDFADRSYEELAGDMRSVCQDLDSNGWQASFVGMKAAVEQNYYDDDTDAFHVMHANMALHDSAVIMHYAVLVDCPNFKSNLSSLDPYINADSWSPDYPGFTNH
jgi:hypothetical protein